MAATGVKLLWGTANLFSHPRYAGGAATSPDPEVYAWAAAQVRCCLETTHRLGGENYVLWGGREGYDSLFNTDLRGSSISTAGSSPWSWSTSTASASRARSSSSPSRSSPPSTSTITTSPPCSPSCSAMG